MKRLTLLFVLIALVGAPARAKAAAEDALRKPSRSSGSFPYLHLIVTAVGIGWSVLIWRSVKRKNEKRRKEWEENPPPPDEGIDESLLPKVPEMLERFGERESVTLPENLLPLAPGIRDFLETWKSVDFWRGGEYEGDPEYDRKTLAVHKDNPAFVLLGGDGGEQTFFVRRDPTDERVYVIDLELDWDLSKPRPYASDIARWILLRKQDNTTE